MMNTNIQRFWNFFAATRAILTCAVWIYFHEIASGILRFIRNFRQKATPAYFQNLLCKHTFCQAFNVQIFNSNKTETINKGARNFVLEVLSLIENVSVNFSQSRRRFTSSVRAFLLSGNASADNAQK